MNAAPENTRDVLERKAMPTEILEIALAISALGYRCIPCLPGSKVPAVKWKRFQTESPTKDDYRAWFGGAQMNIALITTGLVIFDCDDAAKSNLVVDICGDTPHKIQTPRGGIHLGYRARRGVVVGNHVRIKGMDIDIRAENGLEMLPPSRTEYGRYEWLGPGLLPVAQLPIAKISWTRERSRRGMKTLIIDESEEAVVRARAYLACVEGAIAGQRGHDKTFRAACVLVQKFGLSFEQAFPLLKEWSDCSCEPPWSDAELTHKLRDAFRRRSG